MSWISISDQLPPIDQYVLFFYFIEENEDVSEVFYGRYQGRKTAGSAIVMKGDDPDDWTPCTHWMPLPEVPSLESLMELAK